MTSKYTTGIDSSGTSVNGQYTLFVNGVCSKIDILTHAFNNKCPHIHLGANGSFQPVTNEDWVDWNTVIYGLLDDGIMVSLTTDKSRASHLAIAEQYNNFNLRINNNNMAIHEQPQQLADVISNIRQWHHDRNLIDGADDITQFAKLIQECGELSDNICKQRDIRDDIGDIIVVLLNIAERHDLSLTECLEVAYNDIKDRKGRMLDGVFIKEADDQ